jgi:hypothetical protein
MAEPSSHPLCSTGWLRQDRLAEVRARSIDPRGNAIDLGASPAA